MRTEQEMRAEASGEYEDLLPAERLSNAAISEATRKRIEAGEGGAFSPTVQSRLCRATCGWKQAATPAEFQTALGAHEPDSRQRNILDAWATEATPEDIFRAWAEGAYTPRTLAAALHRAGLAKSKASKVPEQLRPGAGNMNQSEELVLPDTASGLWQTTREITRRGIKELTGRSSSYAIGGGTNPRSEVEAPRQR